MKTASRLHRQGPVAACTLPRQNQTFHSLSGLFLSGAMVVAIAIPQLPADAQKTMIQPSDIANLKRVEEPAISPDGKLVAYTVDTPVAAGKPRDAHIWLASAAGDSAARPFG